MAPETMTRQDWDRAFAKFRGLLDLIEAGRVTPDPLELAWAADICKRAGELQLSMRAERIVRHLLPNYIRDLS